MFNLRNVLHGNSSIRPVDHSSRIEGRGVAIADAIAKERMPPDAAALAKRIEGQRRRMLDCPEMLGAWERPWLATSPELQERLNLSGNDGRFETAISVGKACQASKPEKWCRALLTIVLNTRPQSVVEMGTNVGISGLYIAAGLKVNACGRLLTMEGAPSKAVLASQNFDAEDLPAEVVIGDFADTLDQVLERAGQVDLAFIDGFHEGDATIHYHEAFKRSAAPGAVLVYDDINRSDGMKHAWDVIRRDEQVAYVLDYGAIGVVGLH